MKPHQVLAYRTLAALFVFGGPALAQQSYNAPIVGIMASEGRRWGWGSDPGATIGGFGFFAGFRRENWRFGALERNQWWVDGHGIATDFGGFLSHDFASLWVDPQLSTALFWRFEPGVRYKWHEGKWALAPSGVLGGRAAGAEIGFVATPEYWLSDIPNNASKWGVDLQVRLSFEVLEVLHFIEHLSEANDKMTP
jgi:hypothetical protein